MTHIADLSIKVDYIKLPQAAHGIDQEVDATPDVCEEEAQTDPAQNFDVACGKDRDFRLKSKKVGTTEDDNFKVQIRTRATLAITPKEVQLSKEKRKVNMRSTFVKSREKIKTQVLNPSEFPFPSSTFGKMKKQNSGNSAMKANEAIDDIVNSKKSLRMI